MGSTTDKIKGMANEAAGNIKQAAGKAMNKPEWEAEGKAQELGGEAQVEVQAEQNRRDKDDRERDVAPLKPADDALRIDSTAMPMSEVERRIEEAVRLKQQTKS